MNPNPLYKAYKNRDIEGAQPAEQVAILLEKAAAHIKDAKQAIQNKNMEECYFYCEKASTIINGLTKSLSHSTPEQAQMAATLQSYYTMLDQLVGQILSRQDMPSCDVLISSLYDMASTWRQVSAQLEGAPEESPKDTLEETRENLNLST